jgi:NTE family protein
MKTSSSKKRPAPKKQEKLGLALSGGGFRAAFFHLGVLAQMAQQGLLRHVEVISTVSGGSIIGALYYLHLKKLFEAKSDKEVADRDYQLIMERIEVDFLAAVQRNLRMRTFLNPIKNLRMSMFDYSRSQRIGELYDKYIYRPAVDAERTSMIEMRELKILPKGARPDFKPLRDNSTRRAKVPVLLINATTLNTGHNWRFEAVRMGEPERKSSIAMEIDKNMRLRAPKDYQQLPADPQRLGLGVAVAASACVPGIFHPVAISQLYPDGIRVELVDGGVHDNQGLQGLLDLECTRMIVSDASGQMSDESEPRTEITSVVGRTNEVLMDRVREEQLLSLLKPEKDTVAFMHLRRGLSAQAVSWLGSDAQPSAPRLIERQSGTRSELFGVDSKIQGLLSKIRTDLDSFTEVEAYSLMLDGYRMSEVELLQTAKVKKLMPKAATVSPPAWRFLRVARWMANPTPDYEKQLRVGAEQFFKVFRLSWTVMIITGVVVLWTLFGLSQRFGGQILEVGFKIKYLLLSGLIIALLALLKSCYKVKFIRYVCLALEFVTRFVTRGLLPTLGSFFVVITLLIYDPLFLRFGKLERLKEPG